MQAHATECSACKRAHLRSAWWPLGVDSHGKSVVCDGRRVDVVKHKMDHLSCFIPAMLALGAHAGAVTGAKAGKYLQVAEELTHTCWQMYHQMPSGAYSLRIDGWM